jgi:hypothetical protein
MNKFLVSIVVLSFLAVAFGATGCHESCNCTLADEGCAECNICTSCKS